MFKLPVSELEGLDWHPRNYGKRCDVRYGYDKATHPKTGIPGSVVDYVRLPSGLVIPDHYHKVGEEVFVVLYGSAVFQTRKSRRERREETVVEPRDVLKIKPGLLHRVENRGTKPFYLIRFTNKIEGDFFDTEFEEDMEDPHWFAEGSIG
ncbi:MAG TPA: cupin domain-containing protein [archaeon]|nr:cupin domain-containing protein [archaeon]